VKKNNLTNLLIFPCGAISAIEIHNSFKDEKNINTFLANSTNLNNKLYYKKKIIKLPNIDSKIFLISINKIIKKYKINYLYPSTDIVAYFLKKNQKKLFCKILTHNLKTLSICNDKIKTYDFFTSKKMDFLPKKINKKVFKFPIFVKKKISHSSIDAHKINNRNEYDIFFLFKNEDEYLITEYLPGSEFTIDCFTRNRKLIFKMIRARKRTLGGISVENEIILDSNNYLSRNINIIAQKINNLLIFKGVWFFQIKIDKFNKPKLLEIGVRPSGNSDFSRILDINLPLLTFYIFTKKNISINKSPKYIKNNIKILRSYFNFSYKFSRIYVDYDDCISLRNRINEELMGKLFQFKIKNKKIILITKHKKNIYNSLNKLKLGNFFDEILSLKKKGKKYKFIEKTSSIFIDDSFSERLEVSNKLNIPVFSPQSFINL
jgi:hypothetical protein